MIQIGPYNQFSEAYYNGDSISEMYKGKDLVWRKPIKFVIPEDCNFIIDFTNYETEGVKVSGDIGGETIMYVLNNTRRFICKYIEEGKMAMTRLHYGNNSIDYYSDGVECPYERQEDVFIKIPLIHWKVTTDPKKLVHYIEFGVGKAPDDTYIEFGDNQLFGVRGGSFVDDKLYSSRDGMLFVHKPYEASISAARARGKGYTLETWQWRCLWTLFSVFCFGSFDHPSKYGGNMYFGDEIDDGKSAGIDRLFYNSGGQMFIDNMYVRNGVAVLCDDDGNVVRTIGTVPNKSGLLQFQVGRLSIGKYLDILPTDAGKAINCTCWSDGSKANATVRVNACNENTDVLTATYDGNTSGTFVSRPCFEGELIEVTPETFRSLTAINI